MTTSPETARAQSFALLVDLGTKVQILADRDLAPSGITTRQWFLCLVLDQAGESLSLKETAARMGTSHQNAKQLALKLEKKGFLRIEKDPSDTRALRLSLTESCVSFWSERSQRDSKLLESVFRSLGDSELTALHGALKRLDMDLHRLLEYDRQPFTKEES